MIGRGPSSEHQADSRLGPLLDSIVITHGERIVLTAAAA